MKSKDTREGNKVDRKKFLHPIDVIRSEYSKPETIKCYSQVGLWISEKKLIKTYFGERGNVLDFALIFVISFDSIIPPFVVI